MSVMITLALRAERFTVGISVSGPYDDDGNRRRQL
jgi:hypothetical protein